MKVNEIAREALHRGFLKVFRSELSHSLFRGGMSSPIAREHTQSGPVVAVLPYDPVSDRVVLIRQFRIGAWAAGTDPAPWDIVAGIRTGDESVEASAERELIEETGCPSLGLESIGDFLTAPHVSSERLSLVCAFVHAFDGQRQCGLPEEGEDILAASFDATEALALLKTEPMPLWAAMALQWLQSNRERLRRSGPGWRGNL